MKVYGLTGGIGAGKSMVARLFRMLQVPVYDADWEAKRLTHTDPGIRDGVVSIFGAESFSGGQFNRSFVSKVAFSEPDKLKRLNAIIHPAVADHYKRWQEQQNSEYVIREAAIIFEIGMHEHLDGVILVSSPEEVRLNRVLSRDTHRDKKQVLQIMDRQMPEAEKRKLANFYVANDDKTLIIPQVLSLHQRFSTQ